MSVAFTNKLESSLKKSNPLNFVMAAADNGLEALLACSSFIYFCHAAKFFL